jgi:tetratricopeptide (TPR) repeat protein
LLKYDKAYYNGKLLPASLLEQAFTPVKLNNGKNNSANFGLGWEVWTDTSVGKVVYHNGNATGLSCILIRNVSRHQTVILFDNIHYSNSGLLGFAALKMLNGIPVPLPKKSVAAVYGRELLKRGAAAARDMLFQLKKDSMHYYLSEDEMNLLGYDFMGGSNNSNPFRFPEENKYQEALETFKLNVELFPDSWNVYDSYGEILLKLGRKEEAVSMYKKSVALNPNNEGGKKVLNELSKQ